MYRQGAVSLTEFLTVDEKGVTAIARSVENGEPSLCVPPQRILNFPPRAGEKWNYKGSVGARIRKFILLIQPKAAFLPGKHLLSAENFLDGPGFPP